MITLRDIGAVGIKLLGVSYLARTVLSGFSLIAVWFAPADFGPETRLTKDQADYIGVAVEGPYKSAHYRY